METNGNAVEVIAISGVTNGGKTTITKKLKEIIPTAKIFYQDDHYHPLGTEGLEYVDEDPPFYNWDTFSSIDMDSLYLDVKKGIESMKKDGGHVIVEGHLILNYKPLEKLFTSKYFIQLDKNECYRRRLGRVYDPPDTCNYFDKCAWPMYLKFLADLKENIRDVVFLDGTQPPDDAIDLIVKRHNLNVEKNDRK